MPDKKPFFKKINRCCKIPILEKITRLCICILKITRHTGKKEEKNFEKKGNLLPSKLFLNNF
jgi:hypothetical protein